MGFLLIMLVKDSLKCDYESNVPYRKLVSLVSTKKHWQHTSDVQSVVMCFQRLCLHLSLCLRTTATLFPRENKLTGAPVI